MTEVKGDVHLEQVCIDNLKNFKNDLTLKPKAVQKQKTKLVKKSGPSNKKGNGAQQNGVTQRNQTSTPVVQQYMEVESLTLNQIASNDGNDDQQDSDASSIAGEVDGAANKKRKPIKIKMRPTKKRKKTKKNTYEVVPDSTSENVANEEAPQNLHQRAERDSGLEERNEHRTSEVTNQQTNQQQSNDARRRSRRKKRPTKFNGLVYVVLKLKLEFFVRPFESSS